MSAATPPPIDWFARQASRVLCGCVRWVLLTLEEGADRFCDATGQRWLDVRPMVNDREHAPQVIDLNREAIDLGLQLGILTRRGAPEAWLLRIVPAARVFGTDAPADSTAA